MLNENRIVDEGYRATIDNSVGPSRVATAVWIHHGQEALRAWHTAFVSQIFDHWRYPSAEEYHAAAMQALGETGLPTRLAEAAGTDKYDEPLRRSHDEGTAPVGVDGGRQLSTSMGLRFWGGA
jgi:hypothetical protein